MSLATSYAKALYLAAKEAQGTSENLDQVNQELSSFAAVLDGSKEASDVLFGPVVTAKDKTAIINAIAQKAGYSKLVNQFLVLLADKGRLQYFHEVRKAFNEVRLTAEGGVSGQVVSAEAISEADVKSLAASFGRKLGKRVEFQVSTDPSLLAGMKVTVSGVTYDGTLRSQLQQLRDRLLTGASAS